MHKQKSPMGEPVKGAPFFGPDALSALFTTVLMLAFFALVASVWNDPAWYKMHAAGLWLKFWNGEGGWQLARNVAVGFGLLLCWFFLLVWDDMDKKDRKRARKEWKKRHGN